MSELQRMAPRVHIEHVVTEHGDLRHIAVVEDRLVDGMKMPCGSGRVSLRRTTILRKVGHGTFFRPDNSGTIAKADCPHCAVLIRKGGWRTWAFDQAMTA